MSTIVWFWPGVLVSAVLALLFASPAARFLSTTRLLAWVLLVSFGAILAATLTPIHGPGDIDLAQMRPCDLTRTWIISILDLNVVSDVTLNIALFAPLGFGIAQLPRTRRSFLALLVTIALPFVIEGIQYLAPLLARGCESGDVVDNLSGLLLGLAAGTAIRGAVALVRRVGHDRMQVRRIS